MSHQIPEYFRYVSAITIVNPGSGYTVIPTITISGGGGTGATATATIFNGQIQAVNITTVGQDYTTSPTVTVTGGGGSNANLTAVLAFAAGTPTDYEEKSALGVKYTLPEFIQNDYNQFVTFIEKYYEYMDSDGNPINLLLNKRYNDIDDLNDAESNKRAMELAKNFPQILQTDRKSLLKKIKNIYESKGSERSIKAYFKLLYNEEIDIYYPNKNILRASDGVWIQETTVRALAGFNNYEALNLNGRVADIKYYETIGSVNLIKTIPITIPRVEKIATTFPQSYEIIIELPPGTTNIPGPGSQATATATVVNGIITGFILVQSGYDYTAAPDVVISDTGSGTGATARAVVSNGAITSIVLTDTESVYDTTVTSGGSGYTSVPTVTFSSPPSGGTIATGTAVLTSGEVTSITMTNRGSGYTSNPDITFSGGGGANATATSSRKGGENYDSASVSVLFNTDNIRTAIIERGAGSEESNVRAYLDRTLFSVTSGTYVGSNAGFSVGDVFFVNESGDDSGAYAVEGYFLEDYTYSITNNAVIRVASINESKVPTVWTIINPGGSFLTSQSTIAITSKTGQSLDITLITKYLYVYDGKYKDDRGKLSDVNRIQDNYKFQSFSYIIKSAISQDKWVTRFRDLMHPAGMEVFGDLIISHNINFAAFISVESEGLHLHEFKTEDVVISNDDTIVINVQWLRVFVDTATVIQTPALHPEKNVSDVLSASDSYSQDYVESGYLPVNYTGKGISKYIEKVITDTVITSEIFDPGLIFNRDFTDTTTTSDTFVGIALDVTDNVQVDGSITIDLQHESIVDVTNISELPVINIYRDITEAQTATDLPSITIDKPVSDTASIADYGVLNIQDYSPSYFSEDYVGVGVHF